MYVLISVLFVLKDTFLDGSNIGSNLLLKRRFLVTN